VADLDAPGAGLDAGHRFNDPRSGREVMSAAEELLAGAADLLQLAPVGRGQQRRLDELAAGGYGFDPHAEVRTVHAFDIVEHTPAITVDADHAERGSGGRLSRGRKGRLQPGRDFG